MSIYKYKPKPMTKGQMEALSMLLAYNEVDERKHWQEMGQPSEGHIYNSIVKLNDYKRQCHVIDTVKGKKKEYDNA